MIPRHPIEMSQEILKNPSNGDVDNSISMLKYVKYMWKTQTKHVTSPHGPLFYQSPFHPIVGDAAH